MSMMFAALKRMESPAGQVRTARPTATTRAAPHWLVPALCGGALVAAAALAWQGVRPGTAAATATPVVMEAPAGVAEPVHAPVPEATRTPETAVAATATQPPAPVAEPVAEPPRTAMAPVSQPEPERQPEIVVRDAREASNDAGAPEDAAIARDVAAIGTAVRNGDLDGAQAGVDALAAILPPRSLTLLRMQAWVAHQRGDTASALSLYRSIVDRVPSDQTAVINLAILEAAHGQAASARQRLQHLRQADGTSRAVEDAIALVEASLR
jgi:hypothetical protein